MSHKDRYEFFGDIAIGEKFRLYDRFRDNIYLKTDDNAFKTNKKITARIWDSANVDDLRAPCSFVWATRVVRLTDAQ